MSFVNITERSETSTPIGRTVLNLLATFARFQRPTIALRTKGKIAASRRQSMWTVRRPVLCFDTVDKWLVVNDAEVEKGRLAFQPRLDLDGCVAVAQPSTLRGTRRRAHREHLSPAATSGAASWDRCQEGESGPGSGVHSCPRRGLAGDRAARCYAGSMQSLARLASAVTLACSTALAQSVLVIDPQDPAAFPTIQSAITASQDGDILYVASTPPDNWLVFNGKGASLVVAQGAFVYVSSVEVENLPATSRVVLRDLRVNDTISVEGCAGEVVVTDCRVDGRTALFGGVFVVDSARVHIERSQMRVRATRAAIGQSTLFVRSSSVVVQDCNLIGTDGELGFDPGLCQCCLDGSAGGIGIWAGPSSFVRAEGCTVRGGIGGIYLGIWDCVHGEDAPPYVVEASATLQLVGCLAVGPAAPIGQAEVSTSVPPTLSAPRAGSAGGTFVLDFAGEPGETVFVLASPSLGFQSLGLEEGVLEVLSSPGRRRIGSLPLVGSRQAQLLAPPLGPSEVMELAVQAVFVAPSGAIRIAPARLITFQDSAIPPWS